MTIAIDFDGTCVSHEFPRVGNDIGSAHILRELVARGHQLILFTMRSDIVNPQGTENELHLESGTYLTDALNWFQEREIKLYGIQTNPTQHTWTTSPKAYAQLYIDDAAFGCPLKFDPKVSLRPFVDWGKVSQILRATNIL